jgi:hypothetical protein
MKILRTTNQTMRQMVTSQLLAFHRHRRKALAVLMLKIVAVAVVVTVISFQLTSSLHVESNSRIAEGIVLLNNSFVNY